MVGKRFKPSGNSSVSIGQKISQASRSPATCEAACLCLEFGDVVTLARRMNIFTAENRKFGSPVEERAALWDSLVAYTGPYRLEDNKLIVSVDASKNEVWNGTQQVRYWQLEGSRLTITTERRPSSRDPSKMSVVRAVLEKVE